MIFGFNTDVPGKNAVYHVQTEDRGSRNPVIDSIIYVGGKIVDRRRTPYAPTETSQQQIEEIVRKQHKELVEAIRSGHFVPSVPSVASAESVASGGYSIQLLNPTDVYRDGELQFELRVRENQQAPGGGTSLAVRWIADQAASEKRVLTLKEGDGDAAVSFPVPSDGGEAALLVCAEGPAGRQVVKFRVRNHAEAKS
ncbi:MAG: hypothetical protein HY648_01555 [Acidobacteria bacterium]|nr:hypothetical protein [Acidobacteriota bacterium]